MNLGQLIDLLTAIMGFIASLYFAWSALSMTPERILSLTTSHSGIFISDKQIESMADQKANNIVGALLLAFTFLLQIFKPFINNKQALNCTWVIPVVFFLCLLIFLSTLFRSRYREHIILQTLKIEGKRYCVNHIKGKLQPADIRNIVINCGFFMRDKRKNNESLREFLTRYAAYMDCKLLDDLDLSEVEDL